MTANKMSRMSLILVLFVTTMFSGCPMPLPQDLVMRPPGAEIPAKFVSFFGAWEGTFVSKEGGTRDIRLTVASINSLDNVDMVYSFLPFMYTGKGNYSDGSLGYQTPRGKFVGDTLMGRLEGGSEISFEMNANGTLKAVFVGQGIVLATTLHRISG